MDLKEFLWLNLLLIHSNKKLLKTPKTFQLHLSSEILQSFKKPRRLEGCTTPEIECPFAQHKQPK
jgi:hypothetical protein